MKKKIKVVIEKTDTGYSAYCLNMDGIASVGDDWEDVKKEFSEAFEFHLEGLREFGDEDAFEGDYQLRFSLGVEQLFKGYAFFNVSSLADYLGLNKQLLHQYKDGHKFPSEKKSLEILKGLESIGKNFSQLV